MENENSAEDLKQLKVKERNKIYREKNREAMVKYHREYYIKNRDSIALKKETKIKQKQQARKDKFNYIMSQIDNVELDKYEGDERYALFRIQFDTLKAQYKEPNK